MKRRTTKRTMTLPLQPKKAKKGKGGGPSIADALLATMVSVQMKRNHCSISFVSIMKTRKMNDRNTTWRNEWRSMIEKGLIHPSGDDTTAGSGGTFTSNYELTEQGEDRAVSTPAQKEAKRLLELQPKTTEEEHARIRKICMNNRTVQIFDLLLKHGKLTRKELAATIGISDRGAPFSYGLRQLKELGYVLVDKTSSLKGRKVLMISNKAFLDPKDRPETIPIDQQTMAANMEKVYGKEERKKISNKKIKTEAIPVKHEHCSKERMKTANKTEVAVKSKAMVAKKEH